MSITVLCFAGLRERVGFGELDYDAADGASVGQVLDDLCATYPAIAQARKSCLIALNEEYAEMSATVKAGDTLALIPPVSGGRSSKHPIINNVGARHASPASRREP